jgi:hypothetical protein
MVTFWADTCQEARSLAADVSAAGSCGAAQERHTTLKARMNFFMAQ